MNTVVKRAISLPKDQDEKIKKIAKSRKAPYSAVVRAAIDLFLKQSTEKAMEEAYQNFYSDAEEVRKEDLLVKELSGIAYKAWPD